MKKVIGLIVIAGAAVFGLGRFNLGEAGAMRFLSKMELLMDQGEAGKVCAMFDEDLEMEIADRSGEALRRVHGGKSEMCDLTRATIAGLQSVPHDMQVEYTGVNSLRNLTSPWSSELSYAEHRTFTIPGANITLRTVSNDRITLVLTLSGVKLRKLKSEVFKTDAI
jgi:hypothetical protein